MGTRTVFEIVVGETGERPAVVMFSNDSHPKQNAKKIFRQSAKAAGGDGKRPPHGATEFLEQLMTSIYATQGGIHRPGDRVFSLVEEPYGDYETIVRATFVGSRCKISERSREQVESATGA